MKTTAHDQVSRVTKSGSFHRFGARILSLMRTEARPQLRPVVPAAVVIILHFNRP